MLYVHLHILTHSMYTMVNSTNPMDHAHAHMYRRIWSALSLLADADVTWGIASLVARTLRISPVEVETTRCLLLDPDKKQRCVSVCARPPQAPMPQICMRMPINEWMYTHDII